MKIHINGTVYTLIDEDQANISAALALFFKQPQQSTFAVALNGDFIGKDDYQGTSLTHGDSIDILQPIQGG